MINPIFISDIHLSEHQPGIALKFFKFLDTYALPSQSIYILGDLFDSWIGDDESNDFYLSIEQKLKQLTQAGAAIYLMRGNRDFLLGKRFAKNTGCQIIIDPYVITLFDKKVLLTHGDLLNPNDKDYLRFRKKMRNPLYQRLFLWKSIDKRRAMAKQLRHASQRYSQEKSPQLLDVYENEVKRWIKKHNVQFLIHGHTHKPGHFSILLDDEKKIATRIALDSWENGANLLACHLNKLNEPTFELNYV